jgi:hypothetical protein
MRAAKMRHRKQKCQVCESKRQANVANRYNTAGQRENIADSLAYDLLLFRANQMTESYYNSVELHGSHIANASLVGVEVIRNYFVRKLCTAAMRFRSSDCDAYAMDKATRKLIDRYAMADNRKGRIIAYLLTLEYGELDTEEDSDCNDDAILETVGEPIPEDFNNTALGFFDFDYMETVQYRS